MKKQHLILPFALLASLLGSCGRAMSQDEAVAQAKKIIAKRQETSFAYDFSKVSANFYESGNGLANKNEFRSIQGSYYYATSTLTLPNTTSSTSNGSSSLTVLEYVYEKSGTYYDFIDDGNKKTVTTFPSKSEFSARLTALEKDMQSTISDNAKISYNFLDTFVTQVSANSSSSSASSTEEKATFSYSSTGDGNLTLTGEGSTADSWGNSTYKTTHVFNNYLPVSSVGTGSGTVVSSSGVAIIDAKLENSFSWGVCDPIYPNVSDYSSAG